MQEGNVGLTILVFISVFPPHKKGSFERW